MARKRLVVIDDDPRFRGLVEAAFSPDYEVVGAGGGAEGIAACRDGGEVVLVDLCMPRADGLAVVRALACAALTRRIPVLVVTASHVDASTRRELAGQPNVRRTLDKLQGIKALREAVEGIRPKC